MLLHLATFPTIHQPLCHLGPSLPIAFIKSIRAFTLFVVLGSSVSFQ